MSALSSAWEMLRWQGSVLESQHHYLVTVMSLILLEVKMYAVESLMQDINHSYLS